MKFTNYYEVLGISENATQTEIKKAYKELIIKYHPDRNVHLTEKEKLKKEEISKQINNAYDILGKEEKRKEYDLELNKYRAAEEKKEKQRRQQEQEEQQRREEVRRQYEETRRKAEERRKYYEEKRKRAEQEEAQKYSRKNYTKTTMTEDTFSTFKDNVKKFYKTYKKAYDEVKKEEEKISFKERHRNIEDYFYKNEFKEEDNILIKFRNNTIRITEHFIAEGYVQGRKLFTLKKGKVPKYIMRNRYNFTAIALSLFLVTNTIGGMISDKDEELPTNEPVIEQPIDEDQYTSEVEYEKIYNLNRYYEVQSGDSLSYLAYNANTTQDSIRRPEVQNSKTLLQIGEDVIIPYKISEDDLKYYTYTEVFPEKTSLEEFASIYETDSKTLHILNEEAIVFENGKYHVISDSLTVPNFITQDELSAKKAKTKSHQ